MKTILVVDDNATNLTMMNALLSKLYKVYPVNSGKSALKCLKKQEFDLILLDVAMPEMSGIDLIRILKADRELSEIPVIFLTGLNDIKNEAQAFELGAVDYIHKPINSTIMMARVKLHIELESYRRELQILVEERTSQVLQLQKVIIDLLAQVTEYRDTDTGNHVRRTEGYVSAIMDNMGRDIPDSYIISKDYYDDIKKSTPLHDIGKIGIPDSILLKPERLTPEEFEIIKSHVEGGAQLLKNAIDEINGSTFLDVALEIVMTHHEKWNGSGYPNGISGEDIPISGRIMAIADVYDALTSVRPYKTAFSHEKAVQILAEGSGSHFDPVLINIFLNIQDYILEISNKYKRLK